VPESLTLAPALARRAAADPESPFLFWSHGWHWRWWSWRRTAELATRWAAELASLPAGTRVGFAGDVFPQAVALDLAVQAAGLTPVPLAAVPWPGGEAMGAAVHELECAVWVEAPLEGEIRVSTMAPLCARPGSLASLAMRDAAGAWHKVPAPAVAAAARRVGEALGETAGSRERRDIVVLGRSLGDAAGRLVAAWALEAGAAMVLEAAAERRLAAVLWARPTVVCGSRAEILELGGRLAVSAVSAVSAVQPESPVSAGPGEGGPWWQRWPWRHQGRRHQGQGEEAADPGRHGRRPLGRLRAVFQEEAPEAEEIEAWRRRGVWLRHLPALNLDGDYGGRDGIAGGGKG
jgi:hypothetical protein